MMSTLQSTKQVVKLVFLTAVLAVSQPMMAQNSNQLNFENGSRYSGNEGEDNTVYLFPDVNETMDALVKIKGRSSASVTLSNIDVTSTGFSKAFQPQISRGSVTGSSSWWMEFEIKFVNKNTEDAASIAEAYATALDIDGNGSRLREWDAFYGASSYTLESTTQLQVASVTGILNQLTLAGRQFTGVLSDFSGIDTTATQLMATNKYINTNTITVRLGATTTGSVSNTNRMYSVWFKNFAYSAPMNTLPVKLASFTATLNNNNKADLKWTTASEINVSHFVIERSIDGINFSDAGIVFAAGNTSANVNYSFTDNLSAVGATVIWYRLRSVDMDEKTELSATKMIRIGTKNEATISLTVYPNPVKQDLRVTIPATWQNKKLVYEMIAISGQVVSRTQSNSSSQTETLNVQSLAPGIYYVRVACEGQMLQQKIVKQ